MKDDTLYWNDFYNKKHSDITEKSRFAEYILKNKLKEGMQLIEYGCGNGRDALYFSKNRIRVLGIDASKTAIENLKDENTEAVFVCADFTKAEDITEESFDVCYSRFTLHAIDLESEKKLIDQSFRMLKEGGIFCIEARSVNDPIYAKGECVGKDEYFYNDHYRRFLRIEELTKRLAHAGFLIEYAEENIDFAPSSQDNPPIIRVIARKETGL